MSANPYPFVEELLFGLPILGRFFFGGRGIYLEDKILLILYDKDKAGPDKGVWVATEKEHHESLRREIPSLRSISLLSPGGETNWQLIPEDSDDFERAVSTVCDLIRHRDPRIGRIPKKKKSRKTGRFS